MSRRSVFAALSPILEPPTLVDPTSEPKTSNRRWLKLAIRIAIFAVVAAGLGHSIAKALGKFREENFSLTHLHFGWLVASGVLYLLGSVPSWLYWHKAIEAMGGRPSWLASLRAFFIGHLGKYVPGKGMVVVLRAGLVANPTVTKTVAATCVFVETLTTMAVGAVLSAVYIAIAYRDQRLLLSTAVLSAFFAGIPILPPIFRRIVLLLRVNRLDPDIDRALQGINFRLIAAGFLSLTVGWVLMGLSLWCIFQSLPIPPEKMATVLDVLPQLTAVVALAVVAGFVSMLPGGVGTREFVVMTIITPEYGPVAGVASAFLLRFVWLLAELFVSIILYFLPGDRSLNSIPIAPTPQADA